VIVTGPRSYVCASGRDKRRSDNTIKRKSAAGSTFLVPYRSWETRTDAAEDNKQSRTKSESRRRAESGVAKESEGETGNDGVEMKRQNRLVCLSLKPCTTAKGSSANQEMTRGASFFNSAMAQSLLLTLSRMIVVGPFENSWEDCGIGVNVGEL
jgi:hypothetical protein